MEHVIFKGAKPLTEVEEREFSSKYRAGDQEAGMTLLRSQAAWMLDRIGRKKVPSSVDIEDVIGEMVVVLLGALKRYDPDQSRLSTYVTRVIDRRYPRIVRKLAGTMADSISDSATELDTLEDCPKAGIGPPNPEEIQLVNDILLTADLSDEDHRILNDFREGAPLRIIAQRLNDRNVGLAARQYSPGVVHRRLKEITRIIRAALVSRGVLKIPDVQLFLTGMAP